MTTSKPKTPSRRWRVVTADSTVDYTSEKKAYGAVNSLAAIGTAALGLRITVYHWEDGRWGLYERATVTENGWEPA